MSPPGKEHQKRSAVLAALHAHRTPMEILKFLNIPKSTVYAIRKRYGAQLRRAEHEGGGGDTGGQSTGVSAARKTRTGPGKKRKGPLVRAVKRIVTRNPRKSMRTIAKQVGVSPRTVRRIVHQDLGLKSYVLRVKQLLTDDMKKKRVEIGRRLLNSMKGSAKDKIRIFSDEKLFITDQKTNRRNDRFIGDSIEEVPVVMRSKHPAGVMVLGAVSSEGHVMPPHFFGPGEMVTADVYTRTLETKVKPWIESVTGDSPYVFQQDSAPAHTARRTQEWCQGNLRMVWTKDFWPPNSPDLNPMDYYLWSVVEGKVNEHPVPSRDALKRKITEVMKKMDQEEVARACACFRPRLEKVIDAEGGHIE